MDSKRKLRHGKQEGQSFKTHLVALTLVDVLGTLGVAVSLKSYRTD
jgi:hypothetical protein